MKTWYSAVCEEHGEAMECSVNGSTRVYLERKIADSEYDEADLRRQWFDKHYACELRLVWRDDQWDVLYDAGWTKVNKVPGQWAKER